MDRNRTLLVILGVIAAVVAIFALVDRAETPTVTEEPPAATEPETPTPPAP